MNFEYFQIELNSFELIPPILDILADMRENKTQGPLPF